MTSSNKLKAAACVLALVCAPARAKVLEDVVARVNGKPLLLSEYEKNVRSVMENYQRNMPAILRDEAAVKELKAKVLEQMVDDELLAQEGEKSGVKLYAREIDKGVEEVQERNFRVDDATGKKRSDGEARAALLAELGKEGLNEEAFRERIRRQLLIRKVVDDKVRPLVKEPDDKRLTAAFEKLKSIVAGSTDVVKGMPEDSAQAYVAFGLRMREGVAERVRVAHILVKAGTGAAMVERNSALKRAQELKKRIDSGADFGETASKESDDAESAPRGGDLGVILRGWMPPEFEKTAFSVGVGEVSEPVETQFGYHLIRVQEKRAKETLSFERAKGEVAQFLYGLDSQNELVAFIKKLKSAATVELTQPAR